MRVPAGRGALEMDYRPRHVLGQFALDLPDDAFSFLAVRFLGLQRDELLHLGAAIFVVVAFRIAGVVLDEIHIGIVDRKSGEVEAYRIVSLHHLAVPYRGVHHVKFGIDIDLLELVDKDHRGIAIDRDVAGRDLELEGLLRAVSQLVHDRARLGDVLLDICAIAWQRPQHVRGHAPGALRRRLHGAADAELALAEDVIEALAIDRERQSAPQLRVIERRRLPVHEEIDVDASRAQLTYGFGRLRLHVLDQRDRHVGVVGHVELAGHESQDPRRAAWDNADLDRIEVGAPLLPVIRVARELDDLVAPELDELERAGPDRSRAHLARGHVTGIDGRIAGGEEREE